MSGSPAAALYPNGAKGKIELVVDNNDIGQTKVEELNCPRNALTAQVHEGHRLEQGQGIEVGIDSTYYTVELVTKGFPSSPRQLIHHHESEIVSVPGIPGARIPETDDQYISRQLANP